MVEIHSLTKRLHVKSFFQWNEWTYNDKSQLSRVWIIKMSKRHNVKVLHDSQKNIVRNYNNRKSSAFENHLLQFEKNLNTTLYVNWKLLHISND